MRLFIRPRRYFDLVQVYFTDFLCVARSKYITDWWGRYQQTQIRVLMYGWYAHNGVTTFLLSLLVVTLLGTKVIGGGWLLDVWSRGSKYGRITQSQISHIQRVGWRNMCVAWRPLCMLGDLWETKHVSSLISSDSTSQRHDTLFDTWITTFVSRYLHSYFDGMIFQSPYCIIAVLCHTTSQAFFL